MGKLRRTALGGFVIATALVGLGSLSWACTPHAMMADIEPGRGPAGTTVALRGNHFEARQIEIRLGSADGRLLAVATGPELDTTLRIPTDLEPGWIYLTALSRSTEDPTQLSGQATRSFLITSAAAEGETAVTPAPNATGSAPAAETTESAPSPSAAPAAGPAPAAAGPSPGAAPAADPAPAAAGPSGVTAPGTPGAAAAVGGAPAPASGPRASLAGTAPAAAGPSAAATGLVGAPTVGPAPADDGASAPVASPVAPVTTDQRVSSRTATGEAWSSFAGQPSGPGLAADPAGAGDARGAAPAGLILLGVGMAALLATGTAALAHQRRPRKA